MVLLLTTKRTNNDEKIHITTEKTIKKASQPQCHTAEMHASVIIALTHS